MTNLQQDKEEHSCSPADFDNQATQVAGARRADTLRSPPTGGISNEPARPGFQLHADQRRRMLLRMMGLQHCLVESPDVWVSNHVCEVLRALFHRSSASCN